MSAKREFNLFTCYNSSFLGREDEDILEFSINEMPKEDIEGHVPGLDISFIIDPLRIDEDDTYFRYKIIQIPPPNMQKLGCKEVEVDRINMASSIDNTAQIRELGEWLLSIADDIDEQVRICEEYDKNHPSKS